MIGGALKSSGTQFSDGSAKHVVARFLPAMFLSGLRTAGHTAVLQCILQHLLQRILQYPLAHAVGNADRTGLDLCQRRMICFWSSTTSMRLPSIASEAFTARAAATSSDRAARTWPRRIIQMQRTCMQMIAIARAISV